MNKIRRKLRKAKKVHRYLFYIISLIYLVSLIIFIISLIHLNGIETVLRIIIITFFVAYFIFYTFTNLLKLLQRKYKFLIITSFISLAFILLFSIGSYYINVIYNNLNNITDEDELVYTVYLINLKDNELESDKEIGIIAKDIEASDYDLASKLYTKEGLTNDTKTYDDYLKMLSDLYEGVITAAFVPGNYITLFKNEEGFNNIASDTKILYKYTEKRENEDLLLTSTKKFDEPLTFLLMGVDSEDDGLNANAAFNGDTLMLISFNPDTLNTVMLSIPRDTYVPISCRNDAYSKINSAAAYGTSCVINTVSNLLDVDIDYYVKVNFKGVVELVDAINGIVVDVEEPYFNTNNGIDYKGQVCEQDSNRQFGNSTVCMNPGVQTLNGEQALAYSRNRHQYIGGDLDRIKHQQQVVEAIASKVLQFSSLKDFQKILNAISNNIATNMDTNTILSGYQVIKNMVGNLISGDDLLNISKAYLETYSLNVYVPSQGRNTSALGYYTDSLEDIKKAIKVVLGYDTEEEIKTFSFSANETYEIKSPGKGIKTGSSGSLMPSFVGKSVSAAEEFCNSNNIDLHIEYVDSGENYNSSVDVGLIGSQSVHKDVLLSTVKELTVYVSKAKVSTSDEPEETTENNTSDDSNTEESDPGLDIILGN